MHIQESIPGVTMGKIRTCHHSTKNITRKQILCFSRGKKKGKRNAYNKCTFTYSHQVRKDVSHFPVDKVLKNLKLYKHKLLFNETTEHMCGMKIADI